MPTSRLRSVPVICAETFTFRIGSSLPAPLTVWVIAVLAAATAFTRTGGLGRGFRPFAAAMPTAAITTARKTQRKTVICDSFHHQAGDRQPERERHEDRDER